MKPILFTLFVFLVPPLAMASMTMECSATTQQRKTTYFLPNEKYNMDVQYADLGSLYIEARRLANKDLYELSFYTKLREPVSDKAIIKRTHNSVRSFEKSEALHMPYAGSFISVICYL